MKRSAVHDASASQRHRLSSDLFGPSNPIRRGSLVVMINYARRISVSVSNFSTKVVIIVLSDKCCITCVYLGLFFPVTKLIIGLLYINDCPAEPFLPLHLLVGGAVGTARDTWILVTRCCYTDLMYEVRQVQIAATFTLWMFVETIMLLSGSVIIFTTQPDFSPLPTSPTYCNLLVYKLAYWFTVASLVLLLLFLLVAFNLAVIVSCADEELREVVIDETINTRARNKAEELTVNPVSRPEEPLKDSGKPLF